MDNSFLRWTGVPHYHGYQHNERGTESRTKSCDVVHGTSWLPLILHGEPDMENDAAHLHGTAHRLGHSQAHWTLLPGKVGFPKCPIFFEASPRLCVMWKGLFEVTNAQRIVIQFFSCAQPYKHFSISKVIVLVFMAHNFNVWLSHSWQLLSANDEWSVRYLPKVSN